MMKLYNKLLDKQYSKILTKLHKQTLIEHSDNIEYFIIYLMSIRDKLVLNHSGNISTIDTDIKITSLQAAITSYYNYKNSFHKYFKFENNNIVPIDNSKTVEECKKLLTKERETHWVSLMQLISTYYDSWFTI